MFEPITFAAALALVSTVVFIFVISSIGQVNTILDAIQQLEQKIEDLRREDRSRNDV